MEEIKQLIAIQEDIQNPIEKCGNTKQMAITRYLQLERKLNKNTKLGNEYKNVIHEYLELGHIRLVDKDIEDGIYLLHHAVVREDKDTTKVRVVFDASAKGSNGLSLNDTLMIGPTIQNDLLTLIMKWRKFKIAIVSDIVKMYRQVLVNDDDTKFQRIVWRDHPDEDLKSYELLTVTFGTASVPYLAIRTLFQLADDESNKYPLVADILKNSFYVDHLMTGFYDVKEGIKIYEQLTQLLHSGGFKLQKWSSNSEEFLEYIRHNINISDTQSVEIKVDQNIKILGLTWDRNNDKFRFIVNLPEISKSITKRIILSDVAKLFDPFGWVSPTIIIAKILIQKLWLCNSDCNEEVPAHILNEWIESRQQLHELQNIKIDRWLHTNPKNMRVELHGFADASISAYAAVVYVKVIQNYEIHISLLESKKKVARLKNICASGIDDPGFIYLRTTKGTGYKEYNGYTCLFICMKTGAIHIEAISDLTISGFLAASRQLTSRRGYCAEIHNELNSNGAATELRIMFNETKSKFVKEIINLQSNDGTKRQNTSSEVNVGDVIILKDDLPPTKWLLARGLIKYVGPDRQVTVVTQKCEDSTLKQQADSPTKTMKKIGGRSSTIKN